MATMDGKDELLHIHRILSQTMHQKNLIKLYAMSQMECSKNGKITMEVGTHRENDLKAVLKHAECPGLICDVSNTLSEDMVIGTQKISIKHVSGTFGKSGIKAKWTSDTTKANEYIQQMLQNDDKDFINLLIVYIDAKKRRITVVCIEAFVIAGLVRELQEKAFKTAFGKNNRGVEYSKTMIQCMLNNALYCLDIDNVELEKGLSPIERRMSLLSITTIQ
jgi:hypothetical protein